MHKFQFLPQVSANSIKMAKKELLLDGEEGGRGKEKRNLIKIYN
jgi:hypothetical protein